MSSEVIAHVQSLHRKAIELEQKGHLLRAAENYKRAADAARALDSGPDNLVTLEMQRAQASALMNNAAALDNNSADPSVVAPRADCVALLSAVVAALERRRVAGTLMEGKCTAAEEAWHAAYLMELNMPASEASWQAPFVGRDLFYRAAISFLGFLLNARWFAADCSASQFQAFAQHVVHATDVLQQPRSHGTTAMVTEIYLTQKLSSALKADESGVPQLQARRLDVSLVQLLTDAWQRLQQSGVLETRGILNVLQRHKHRTYHDTHNTLATAIEAAMSAPGLRSCALAGCGAREAHPQHFKSCAACRTVVYCCREHQVEGWPSHKKACKAACKDAAASSDGGAGPSTAS